MHYPEPINPSYHPRIHHNITNKNPTNSTTANTNTNTNTHINPRNSQNIIDRNSIPYLDRDRDRDRDKTIDQNYYNQKSTLSRIPHANRYSYTNFVTLGNQDDVLLGIRERDGEGDSSGSGELGVRVGRKIGKDGGEDDKDIGMYKKKIQVLVRDNQILVQAHRKLQIQTIKLRDINKTLQFQIKSLLNQLTTQIKSSTIPKQTTQKPQNHPNNPQNLPTTPSKHSPLPLLPPPPPSTSIPLHFQILIQNLQQQNKLLIQYKDSCLIKISQLSQNIQFIHTALERQRQENIYKGQKLKQMRELHKQDMYNVKNMEKLIVEANNQLNMILRDAKSKEEQAGAVHEKFHKEMAKMKAKTDKYKDKMEQYRKQRDLLALQIQRAKIQIGTVTLRKYFPEDSDD